MLFSLFYFFVALFLLISIHEYGHFIVARLCGVKVLRFSFGFGKILASFKDKKGTQFVWALFPLGGYVKMLDENEGAVSDAEKHMAFNRKSVWSRIAIVIAGPMFNFLFALFAFWLVLVIGIKSLAPIIENVDPNSIAARIGIKNNQEIISLNGHKINSWRDVQLKLMPLIGKDGYATLTVQSLTNQERYSVHLPLNNWQLDAKNPNVLKSIGINPFIPQILPIIGEILPDSAAFASGLKINDVIFEINKHKIHNWQEVVSFVRKHPDEVLIFGIKRDNVNKYLSVHPKSIEKNGKYISMIGVRPKDPDWPKDWLRVDRENPLTATKTALKQTIDLTGATFNLIGRLVMGKISLQSISGPVGIAEGAGGSARNGLSYYLTFLALVSISLGVLNLLPIPILDGGHLLYFVYEVIMRRPLSERVKTIGMYCGLLLLIIVMGIALTNDLNRIFS